MYFAFPKCGSEMMRENLNLKRDENWINDYNPENWDACPLLYCHARPSRIVASLESSETDIQMFTLTRNVYARLVSAYNYLIIDDYFDTNMTFDMFIQNIASAVQNNRFESIPMCWMFAPFDLYFAGVIDQIKVFQLDDLDAVDAFLSIYNIEPLSREVINSKSHDDYRTFYTNPEIILAVQSIFAYEIERFGYKL